MKKFISILIIFIILITIGILEEVLVHKFITEFETKTLEISQQLNANFDETKTDTILVKVDNLRNYWNGKKNKFCYLVMYDKIKIIDEGVAKLSNAVKNNDIVIAQENIAVLLCYTESLHYIMGFNINNLF